MNPLRIKGANYRTFEKFDLELPSGCVAILGANGAGKSSIANVPDLALFGPSGRSWAPYLTLGTESTELDLELEFEHAGDVFRVRRGYSARGGGKTTLDLEIQLPHKTEPVYTWDTLTLGDQKATQARIEEILGFNRQTFRASSMLVQGDGAAFTEATASRRKEIIARGMGLERFEGWLAAVRADMRKAERRRDELAGQLRTADVEIATLPGVERKLAIATDVTKEAWKAMQDAEAEQVKAAEFVQQAEQARSARASAAQTLAEARQALQPIEARLADAAAASRERAIAQDEADSLPSAVAIDELEARKAALNQQVEGYRQACIQRDVIERDANRQRMHREEILARAKTARTDGARLSDEIIALEQSTAAVCDGCGSQLDDEHRAKRISTKRDDLQRLADRATELDRQAEGILVAEIPALPPRPTDAAQELTTIEGRLKEARQAGEQRARLEGRIDGLDRRVAASPTSAEIRLARSAVQIAEGLVADAPAEPDPAAVDVARADALRHRGRVEEERLRWQSFSADLTRAESEIERLKKLRAETDAARKESASLARQLEDLEVLERAYGRDGIPALIVQQVALPSIQREANRILGELGSEYTVELRTEKVTGDGGIVDALDVIVQTLDGERAYETFSGGERTRINLALRIGFARLLAHRRGAESRILVIDEPEYLDDAGTTALIGVLRGLAGDFERIYLISHVPALRDAALDGTIEIVRGPDGWSQVAA